MTRAQKFQDVINQALTDASFAATLGEHAVDALCSGVGSPKWVTLVTPFARNSQDLAELTTLQSASGSCTVPTSFLLHAASTAVCTLTTTTTTTSYFCTEPKSAKKAKGKKR